MAWQELDEICVLPLKEPDLSAGQFSNMILRVQALAIGGTDKAQQDTIKYTQLKTETMGLPQWM